MPGLSGLAGAPPFPTSELVPTSVAVGTVGELAKDKDGNIYCLVDFQDATLGASGSGAGEVVVFNGNYEASKPTSTSRGRIGVVMANDRTSDKKGWVMVFGRYSGAWATSGVTSAGLLFIPVTSDAGYFDEMTTTNANVVYGAWARSASSTATSPGGFSSTVLGLIDVELNFPYVNAVANAIVHSS